MLIFGGEKAATQAATNERIVMKVLHTNLIPDDEARAFREAYRKLADAARVHFANDEWRKARALVARGVAAGAYGDGGDGLSPIVVSMATATVVAEKAGLGRASLLMVMLHAVVAHGLVTPEAVATDFGDDAARLAERMAHVKEIYVNDATVEDENFRKMLISMAGDVRVVIGLIAERYVLMKMLNHRPGPLRDRIVRECRALYTPIAHRLGLYVIKGELEDMALKYTDRDTYDSIARSLNETKAGREAYIADFIAPVKARLAAADLHFSIKGRTKSISSIWHKMQVQHTTIDGIYDLFAIRIIIDAPADMEKALCWQAYGIVTDMYAPNPKRLKDWISIPKGNGYESLHITVCGPGGRWVEVQIRTRRMDDIAERGLAAHWRYKGIKGDAEADRVMASIREALEAGTSPDEQTGGFAMSLYDEEIFVFTPGGALHRLPKGATVLDFAFDIHTDLGIRCTGAKIGNKNVKINHVLHSGDTVEVLTASGQVPKQDWLAFVHTSKARSRIKQSLKEAEMREAETGKELLERRFRNRKIDIDEGVLAKLIARMGYKTQTAFYQALSTGLLDTSVVADRYEEAARPVRPEQVGTHGADLFNIALATPDGVADGRGEAGGLVIGDDTRGLDYSLARCCHPIHGDDVVGFISVGGGIRIHRADCPNLAAMRVRCPYRIVAARWAGRSGGQYSITLRVVGHDDIGIVANISSIINKETGILLRSINIDSHDGLFQGHLTVSVGDLNALNALVKKIRDVKGVKSVERMNHS